MHSVYILIRFLLFRGSLTRNTWLLYFVLSSPALIIELLFEKNSRPSYGSDGEVKRAGDDLEAKGLTEYLFDVLYWSWGCIVLAAIFGNRMWWLWAVVPVYSGYAAYNAFTGVRNSLTGMGAAGGEGGNATAVSKRQQKLEKRGGQQIQKKR